MREYINELPAKPERRAGERMLAYYERVNQWERVYRKAAEREARAIDTMCARPTGNRVERATTVDAKRAQLSLHDYASTNDVLRRILRSNPSLV